LSRGTPGVSFNFISYVEVVFSRWGVHPPPPNPEPYVEKETQRRVKGYVYYVLCLFMFMFHKDIFLKPAAQMEQTLSY